MMKKADYTADEIKTIILTAQELKNCKNTTFYTGHCTGERAFEIMKEIMGDQLVYVHCGDELMR
jgi:7,8-dihydropterin-6-yl-methyl-4-(beta-D-ribofuranosyl)aminobenzene 5'-phosphate synthase